MRDRLLYSFFNVPEVQKIGVYAIHNKTNNKYYALAIIDRQQAQKLIEPAYAMIDSKMQTMANNIDKEENKWHALQYAFAMEDLFAQRQELDEEYKLMSIIYSSVIKAIRWYFTIHTELCAPVISF